MLRIVRSRCATSTGFTVRLAPIYALNEPLGPLTKREADSAIVQARQHIDESTFNAAWAEGEKMSLDEVLDLALKTVEEM